MSKKTNFRIAGFSRYEFNAKGEAFNQATGKPLTQESAVKFPAFRLINDSGSREVVKVDFIKEQAPKAEPKAVPAQEPGKKAIADAVYEGDAPASFINWTGISKKVVPELVANYMPADVKRLHYFFVGDGALFFAIVGRFKNAYICDTNKYVLAAYKGVKESPEEVATELEYFATRHSQEAYDRIRQEMLTTTALPLLAADVIYTNHAAITGFCWRSNKKGMFNLPFSKSPLQALPSKENLINCSKEMADTSTFRIAGDTMDDMPHLGRTGPQDFIVIDAAAITMHGAPLEDFAREQHKNGARVLIHCKDLNTRVLGFSDFFIGKRKFLKNY